MNKRPRVSLTSNSSTPTRNANERPRASQVSNKGKGKEVQRTNNPNLINIAERAAKAVALRRTDQPRGGSSTTLDGNRWVTEIGTEVAAQMVRDVRADLDTYNTGCSVCWATGGYDDWREHESGKDCPTAPLDDVATTGWKSFKDSLRFQKGLMCWNCYLPTVR